jgi:hypothetical protein
MSQKRKLTTKQKSAYKNNPLKLSGKVFLHQATAKDSTISPEGLLYKVKRVVSEGSKIVYDVQFEEFEDTVDIDQAEMNDMLEDSILISS